MARLVWVASVLLAVSLSAAQWSVNRDTDGVSASAVSNDGHLGINILCTTEGNTMAGIGSWVFRELQLERGEEYLVEWGIPGGDDFSEMMVFLPGAPSSLLSKQPVEFARKLARSSPEAVFYTETAIDAVSLSGAYRAIAAVADACGWVP